MKNNILFKETFAPIRGSLLEPSTTRPVINDCEKDVNEIKKTTKNCKILK